MALAPAEQIWGESKELSLEWEARPPVGWESPPRTQCGGQNEATGTRWEGAVHRSPTRWRAPWGPCLELDLGPDR